MPLEVVDTPFGRFQVNPEECIGATVKAGTIWDGPGFLQVLAREYGELGTPGVTILDVGAHLGDWTIWLAREGAWRVVAVEPAPYLVQMLKANLDLNKAACADRVVLLEVAAYDRATTLQWRIPYVERDAGGADLIPAEGDPTAIPAYPLDAFRNCFGQRVSLIKIDAQGCDAQAICGLERTITLHRPVVIFEWEAALAAAHGAAAMTLEQVYAWFRDRHYLVEEWPSHRHNYVARPVERCR